MHLFRKERGRYRLFVSKPPLPRLVEKAMPTFAEGKQGEDENLALHILAAEGSRFLLALLFKLF